MKFAFKINLFLYSMCIPNARGSFEREEETGKKGFLSSLQGTTKTLYYDLANVMQNDIYVSEQKIPLSSPPVHPK